jgi:type IV pilus assembly protein PilY1
MKNRTRSLTLIFAMTLSGSGNAITPATTPLYLNSPVEPNIMFTLDDSGSMQWEILPESITYFAYLYPAPANMYGGTNYANELPNFNLANQYNTFLRSPNNNRIYYNPAITYKPWANHDGTTWANASPTCANHNPANAAAGCRDLTVDNTDSAKWWTGGAWTAAGTAHTYYPAVYFRYNNGNVWNTGSYTRIQIKPANAPFSGDGRASRTDCTAGSCTYDQEIQNFANWYSYYRSRISLARSGVGHAFANQSTNMRVGFAAINQASATIDSETSPGAIVHGVRPFSGADRQNFFDELYSYTINSGGTPLRRAMDDVGKYFERTDNSGPWGEFPGIGGGAQYSCRQNYNIFMTDGYWNGAAAPTAAAQGNVDGTAGSAITGTINGQSASFTYNPGPPYSDTHNNTLADVAMYYWNRDLRTDVGMSNNVPTSPANPAFWQHMVNFTVGLGVTGSLNPITDITAIIDGSLSWPAPVSGSTTGVNIDDLWHAAVNSHGDFFSASDPETFAQSLSDVLIEISKRTSSSSSVATSTTELKSGSKYFQSLSVNGEWSGTLVSKLISNDSLIWDSSLKVGANQLSANSDTRVILTKSGINGVAFSYANLTAAQKTLLDTDKNGTVDNRGADRVGYLRGHSQHEGASATDFRQRPNGKIGDIVHSNPWYVGAPSAGYSEFNNSGYKAFRDANLARMPIVYVGANDGMLHGFNACEIGQVYSGGVTCTAAWQVARPSPMCPASVYTNLSWLTSQEYNDNHHFYVDGSSWWATP